MAFRSRSNFLVLVEKDWRIIFLIFVFKVVEEAPPASSIDESPTAVAEPAEQPDEVQQQQQQPEEEQPQVIAEAEAEAEAEQVVVEDQPAAPVAVETQEETPATDADSAAADQVTVSSD